MYGRSGQRPRGEEQTLLADEVLLEIARLYGRQKSAEAKPAALLARVDGKPVAWRFQHKARTSSLTPPPAAVILTQMAMTLQPGETLGQFALVLNYTPTDWCLGLSWLLGIRYVLYPGVEGRATALRTGVDDVESTGFPAWDLSRWAWKVRYDRTGARFRGTQADDIKPIVESVSGAAEYAQLAFGGVAFRPPPTIPPGQSFVALPGNAFREDLFMRTACALVDSTWKHGGGRPVGRSGHNIGAIAVGPDDRILGWAVNVSEVSKCFHAESLLVFKLRSSGAAMAGLRIFCTLEPCHMCAGMITTLCKGAEVIYAMGDPKIKNSSLARGRNNCRQRASTTMDSESETIPALLARLKTEDRVANNTTGFLDHQTAARSAFRRSAAKMGNLRDTYGSPSPGVNQLVRRLNATEGTLEAAAERRRMLTGLLDVHVATPTRGSLDHLGVDVPRLGPQARWLGANKGMHIPFVSYLATFLKGLEQNAIQ